MLVERRLDQSGSLPVRAGDAQVGRASVAQPRPPTPVLAWDGACQGRASQAESRHHIRHVPSTAGQQVREG